MIIGIAIVLQFVREYTFENWSEIDNQLKLIYTCMNKIITEYNEYKSHVYLPLKGKQLGEMNVSSV